MIGVLARASMLLAVAPSAPVAWWPGSRTLPDSVLRRLPRVVQPQQVTRLFPSGSPVVAIPVEGARPVPSRRPDPPVGPMLAAAPWGEPAVPFAGVTVSTCQVPRQWLRPGIRSAEIDRPAPRANGAGRSHPTARDHHPVPATTPAMVRDRRPASATRSLPAHGDPCLGSVRIARRSGGGRPLLAPLRPGGSSTRSPGRRRTYRPTSTVIWYSGRWQFAIERWSEHRNLSSRAPRRYTDNPPLRSPIRPSSGETTTQGDSPRSDRAGVPGRSPGCSHVLPIPRRRSASERSPSDDFGVRPRAVTCSVPPMAARRSWTSTRPARWRPVTSVATAAG